MRISLNTHLEIYQIPYVIRIHFLKYYTYNTIYIMCDLFYLYTGVVHT